MQSAMRIDPQAVLAYSKGLVDLGKEDWLLQAVPGRPL
jgi:hypothetical protein